MVRKAVLWALIVVGAIVLGLAVNFAPALAGDTPLGLHPYNLDVQHNGGFNGTDTSQASLTFDGNKGNALANLKVSEASPLSDQNLGPLLLISDVSASKNGTGLSATAADSSRIVDTHRMRLGTLLIKGFPQAQGTLDTVTVVRLAIQIRTHAFGQADSNSTFAFYPYGVAAPGMYGAGLDTAEVGHLYTGYTGSGTGNAYSGEIIVEISRKRTGVGGGETTPIAANGRLFNYPNGIAIPIQSLYGRDLYSPYTSIRVRSLGPTPIDVQVWLVGSPL